MSKFFKQLIFNLSYLFRPRWDTGIPAPELVRFVNEHTPGKAIDIGCGTGTNVLYLAQHGWSVTGIDFAPLAIEKARRKLGRQAATLLAADVTHLPELDLPGPYDLALDMGCFHSLAHPDRQAYVKGLARWLRPRGIFMIYAFQPADPQGGMGIPRGTMIEYFAEQFTLSGYEQGQGRPSAWYYFEKK